MKKVKKQKKGDVDEVEMDDVGHVDDDCEWSVL